jgi:hypothetical protein
MLINYVPSSHGSSWAGPIAVQSNEGKFGLVPLDHGFVLFEFKSVSGDEVSVLVTCSVGGESWQNDLESLNWDKGETGTKCVEFGDFGPYDANAPPQCDYQISIIRHPLDNDFSVMWTTIYN